MKLNQRIHERSASGALRELQNYFVVIMYCFGESFFNHGFQHHRGLMLIQQHKLRIDIGFDGKLMQQT